MPSYQHVGLIGAGDMASALAVPMIKAGTKITFWNRSHDRPPVKALIAAGGKLETDIQKVIAASDGVLIVCLLDKASVEEVLGKFNLAGKTIINLTTGSPKEAVELQAWMRERKVAKFYDAAMLAIPEMLGTENSWIVYSGESEEEFNRTVRKLLEPSSQIIYGGPDVTGAAVYDYAILTTYFGMLGGATTGLAYLKKLEKAGSSRSITAIFDAIAKPTERVVADTLANMAKAVEEEDWANPMGGGILMQQTALQGLIDYLKEDGIDTRNLEPLAATWKAVMSKKGGKGGIAQGVLELS